MKKREKGFTLVELLVVITIMGIMGTLLVTNYTEYVDETKQTVVDEQLSEVVKAFELSIIDNEQVDDKVISGYNDIKQFTDLKAFYKSLTGSDLPSSSKLTMDDTKITYENNGKTATYTYAK